MRFSALAALAALALLAGSALAEDEAKPKPNTPEQAASKVATAFRTNDGAALEALAEKDDPDPWLVADALCSRGEHDAAAAFAAAAPRVDVKKLPAYVAAQRGKARNGAAREALAAGAAALSAGDLPAALAALDPAKAAADDVTSARLLHRRAKVLQRMRRLEPGAAAFLAAADKAERIGWIASVPIALYNAGLCADLRSDRKGALEAWERCRAIQETRGDLAGVAGALINLSNVHKNLGSLAKALELCERGMELAETIGHEWFASNATVNLGSIHQAAGSPVKALGYYERGLKRMVERGDRRGEATTLGRIGTVYIQLSDLPKALAYQERALAARRQLADPMGVAESLANLGVIHEHLGEFARALERFGQTLATMERLGHRAGMASCLRLIGSVHSQRGAFALALDCYERALKLSRAVGDRRGSAEAIGSLGNIHARLGSHERALALQKQAMALFEEVGDRRGIAATLARIGLVHEDLGAYAEALAHLGRALKLTEETGPRRNVPALLGNMGNINMGLGAYAEALACQQRALELMRELGNRSGEAAALASIGANHLEQGDFEKARAITERALKMARDLGAFAAEVSCLWNLAAAHLGLGDPRAAARAGRAALERLPFVVENLAEEQGALARDEWAGRTETGVRAGMALGDAAEVGFFIESGRAGALLESLGGRAALGETVLPRELAAEQTAARAALLAAQARLGRARAARKRKEIRAARKALDAAQQDALDAVARIQRAAKAAADVAYPRATPLDEIRGGLAAGEALVSYVLVSDEAVALVVTAGDARIARLGKTPAVVAAAKALDPRSPQADPSAARDALRRLVVAPLGLDASAKRLLISPAGALSYVPFAVLAPEREIAYVPSGTTWGALRRDRAARGGSVLALGDPVYAKGTGLSSLPATREEARTIGDVVLLGERAGEATLRSVLGEHERWRAVHFACHGLIRANRPQLSALALTPDPGNDGQLTVLEIFDMRIPADLVVLSACETARGKLYRSEGIVGFTRAFMMAGAPRVIVSLWKVDDEATQALMVKFYELWKPGTTATATALKKAQEFVASHEKWKHPYYWAAWQLWGLGD